MINWQEELSNLIDASNAYKFKNFDTKNPIILYGAGSLGRMAISLLNEKEIVPKYIIDKNLEGKINNIPIRKLSELTFNEIETSLFIICISSIEFMPIYNDLIDIGCKHIIQFYDYSEIFFNNILGNGWSKSTLSDDERNQVERVFQNLEHDKNSVAHYLQFLYWKFRRIEYIYDAFPVLSNHKYFKANCFPFLSKNERYLDCGAHVGNTILNFIEITQMQYSKIWAFEPDKYNMTSLKEKTNKYKSIEYFQSVLSNIDEEEVLFYDNLGFASKVDKEGNEKIHTRTIDSYKLSPTIIKLHLEGLELKALEGSQKTIIESRPIIMVLADHNEDGLYKIANFLINLENYKLYFYLHDYCGNSAVFYAIPEERENTL